MNIDFMEALSEIEREKGISKDVLVEAIEAALISSYKRNFNTAQNVRVDIDRESGVIKVYARKTVVDEVLDPRLEISLEAARAINPNFQYDDIVEIEVTPRDFGRIAAQTAKQVVTQRIREAERGLIYDAFIDKEEDIVTGLVQRSDARNMYVDLGKVEAVLPLNELMPTDQFQQGDRIKAYITRVENTTKGPQILLSRTHPGLLKRLFELEVPEIYEGLVEIKSVSREAGFRSKIAVHSNDPEVDPVGSCVGPKGARVQTIVAELRGEKIDIVRWSDQIEEYVANALSPSKVVEVKVYEEEKMCRVIVPDYQLSLAIGIKGQNARLAAKLTGWKIDIKSESQYEEWAQEQLFSTPSDDQDDGEEEAVETIEEMDAASIEAEMDEGETMEEVEADETDVSAQATEDDDTEGSEDAEEAEEAEEADDMDEADVSDEDEDAVDREE